MNLLIIALLILGIADFNCAFSPEEGSHIEGDILEPPSNDGIFRGMRMWENGVVPYKFDENFPEYAQRKVLRAFKEFHKNTCIRFREATRQDRSYIIIKDTSPPECSSNVGRMDDPQSVTLSVPECVDSFGIILHELMHALGIFHEQSRRDRDKFLRILWDNIKNGTEGNFELPRRETSTYGVRYNPRSVMHYPLDAFGKIVNNKHLPTIELKNKSISTHLFAQRINFSRLDLLKINRMYNCSMEGLNFEDRPDEY